MPKLWPSGRLWHDPRLSCFLNTSRLTAKPLCQLELKWKHPIASTSTVSGLFNSLLFIQSSYELLIYFSSFIHITCSLSVSHSYLVLWEVYLPFRAAVPNKSIFQTATSNLIDAVRGFHSPWRSISGHLSFKGSVNGCSIDFISSRLKDNNFHLRLLPLHLPLLKLL